MVLRRAFVCLGLVTFCLAMVVGCTPAVDSSPVSPTSQNASSGGGCGQVSPGVTTPPGQACPSVTVPIDQPPPSVTVSQQSW